MRKIESEVNKICKNRMIGFQSAEEYASLIARVIETLAGEENLTIKDAQAILSDSIIILPMVIKL